MLAATACVWALGFTAGAAARVNEALSVDAIPLPSTILMDGRILAESKQRILAGDAELQPAMSNLLSDAERVMQEGTFSVMDKTKLPPSGDKHDYASYARYWWPDPDSPEGLPYIRRDGETNPDSQSPAESDRFHMDKMVFGVETLGLAYYLTGEERYAEKAALLLRTWFLNPETRMNPNLNFSQGVPGVSLGSKYGVIDSRVFCRALDGAILISDSPALSASEMDALRAWVSEYLDWLKTSEIAQGEAKALNNHGTFFDAQAMYFALFSGDTEFARQLAEAAVEKRILEQIEPDGSQPEELDRSRGLHYSIFNLQAMFELARMAEQVGVDLWHVGDSRIKAALDFLAPYADPELPFPDPEVKKTKRVKLLSLLLYAADVYHDDTYRQIIEKLPAAEREELRENLAVPLMR